MTTSRENIWQPFEFFVGAWKGMGGGEPGTGEYQRSYRFIFNKKFLEIKNKSTYPPSENVPRGEVHQDIGYISFDRLRRIFILRQFHVEGFVNQYALENVSDDERSFVFVTEAIENILPGWRARESYQVIGENEFSETFELAPPNSEFEVYTRVTLRRVSR